MEQIAQFDERQRLRRDASDRSMRRRRIVAYAAIFLASVGFVLQIVGGWPS